MLYLFTPRQIPKMPPESFEIDEIPDFLVPFVMILQVRFKVRTVDVVPDLLINFAGESNSIDGDSNAHFSKVWKVFRGLNSFATPVIVSESPIRGNRNASSRPKGFPHLDVRCFLVIIK